MELSGEGMDMGSMSRSKMAGEEGYLNECVRQVEGEN